MKLPRSIQTYFDADKSAREAAPVSAFAPDAIVKDEGETHVGRRAIEAWWIAAKARYEHKAEPREVSVERGLTVVRAAVTGRFPASPAMLTFAFQLKDGQIAELEIGA